jgi:hypothetical protein
MDSGLGTCNALVLVRDSKHTWLGIVQRRKRRALVRMEHCQWHWQSQPGGLGPAPLALPVPVAAAARQCCTPSRKALLTLMRCVYVATDIFPLWVFNVAGHNTSGPVDSPKRHGACSTRQINRLPWRLRGLQQDLDQQYFGDSNGVGCSGAGVAPWASERNHPRAQPHQFRRVRRSPSA